jgi:probable rRNA maturation factor
MHSPAEPLPDITIHSEVALPSAMTEDVVASLVAFILQAEEFFQPWQMGIEFVDDATMQDAHVEFMGIDEPTDIMTFPYADDDGEFGMPIPDEPDVAGGDLIISVDRAAENASAAGWETSDELFFLVAHGVLHLLGWDDASDEERQAMLRRQGELISAWRESPEAMQ